MDSNQTENKKDDKNLDKSKRRNKMFLIFGAVIGSVSLIFFLYYFFIGSHYVKTDNAYVSAEVAQVTPAVGGIVKEVRVNDTQKVKKGDILLVIDDTDAKLNQQKANADFSRAEANLKRATLEYNRRWNLRNSGSVSKEEIDNVKAALEEAKALFEIAKSNQSQAKINFKRTIVTSPVNGVVANRKVQIGQNIASGFPVMSVVPTSTIHVDANFKEVQLKNVRIGQDVKLTSDLYGSKVVYKGKVSGISGGTGSAFSIIPTQNATGNWIKVVQRVSVRIDLDPEELKQNPLQIGLSMHVSINTKSK